MSRTLMNRLMVHAPENVVADWALYNRTVPTDLWPGCGPSVEVGMSMLKGKSAIEVGDFVKYFTNPDLLTEVARTDDRVRVAHALVETGRLPYDGYKTLLEKHARRRSILDRIKQRTTGLRLHEISALDLPMGPYDMLHEAREVGLLAALDAGEDATILVKALLKKYIGPPESSTPSATHAEILEAFTRYYSTCELPIEDLVVPEGTERWIVEVPGAAEKLLHAIVEGPNSPEGWRRQVLANFLLNLPEDLDGPVPDVKNLLDRHPEGSESYAAGTAADILSAWFQKRPASATEIQHLEEILDSISGKMSDSRFNRSCASTLYVTPETLLEARIIGGRTFELQVRRPLAAATEVLDQDELSSQTKFLRLGVLLRHGIGSETLEGISESELHQQVLAFVEKFVSHLPEVGDAAASQVLVALQSSSVVWRQALQSPHVGTILDFFADLIGLAVGSGLVRNLPPELSSDLRDRVLDRLRSAECEDIAWDRGAQHLLETEVGCETPKVLLDLDYDRFVRIIMGPALVGGHTFTAHKHLPSVVDSLKSVAEVATLECESGDSSKLDDLLKLVAASKDPQVNFTVRMRLATSEYGVMSGAFPLREVLGYSESDKTIAALFGKHFGDDTSRWQLATEMAADWEGTMPELLDVVEATG